MLVRDKRRMAPHGNGPYFLGSCDSKIESGFPVTRSGTTSRRFFDLDASLENIKKFLE